MAQDRKLDRHVKRGYLLRTDPDDLLERIDAVMGQRQRARLISRLVGDFLDGKPMPTVGELLQEWDIP